MDDAAARAPLTPALVDRTQDGDALTMRGYLLASVILLIIKPFDSVVDS